MINCTISIWGNPNGRGYIVNGRESHLMTLADCDLRNIDGDSVYQGEYYSVMYTDRGYIISHHYILKNEGMIASEFGGMINFRDPRTVTSIAVPRGYILKGAANIFEKLRSEYYKEIGKLITIDELSSRIASALPDWEIEVSKDIKEGAIALRVNTKDERAKGIVAYSSLEDLGSYLNTLERLSYKGYKVIYFVPQISAASFAGMTAIPVFPSFTPSYRVILPDGREKIIKSLDEEIDETIRISNHEDLCLQGTIATKISDWNIQTSEDRYEYKIGKKPIPMKKTIRIDCKNEGTGTIMSDLKNILKPSLGEIKGSVLVLTGNEIETYSKSRCNIIVNSPFRDVSIKYMIVNDEPVIKIHIIQQVSFDPNAYKEQIKNRYGFDPEVLCNGIKVDTIIKKDITEALNCRITIKGSEDYESYEMSMPTDGWVPAITLKKSESKKIRFEVSNPEALKAIESGQKIEVSSFPSEKHKLRKHKFSLYTGKMQEEFDPSFLKARREYEATLKGFRPFPFELPKEIPSLPIKLDFKPTFWKSLMNNVGWIALIVMSFILGCAAGFGLKYFVDKVEEKKEVAREFDKAKSDLVNLYQKLTTVEFTSTDVKSTEDFIAQHNELKETEEYLKANTLIATANVILDLCEGNDDALNDLKGRELSKVQDSLINIIIQEEQGLNNIDQRSASLNNLMITLEAQKRKSESHTQRTEQIREDYTRLCTNLKSLSCTLDDLNKIIDFAERNIPGYNTEPKDPSYVAAYNTKLFINAFMGKKVDGTDTKDYKKLDDIERINTNRIQKLPQDAQTLFNKIIENKDEISILYPFDATFKSFEDIKMYIEDKAGITLD